MVGDYHRIAYTEWGDEWAERTVVCVHGMVRNSRDFDALAERLSVQGGYRAACPDMPGRGESDWLLNPAHYNNVQYVLDCVALIARLDVDQVDWIGTSMGGLIGMMLAAQPRSPIRRLILNDVGPVVTKEALERIKSYVGVDQAFDTLNDLEAYMRQIYASLGPLTHAQWRHFARHWERRRPDGKIAPNYDPAIGLPLQQGPIEDVVLWPMWDQIRCPVLVLRGAQSDVLMRETAEEMTRRGPRAELVEFPDCGHVPPLMNDEQISVIEHWLGGEKP
jgi:pimeloyl-ACP methyl ester carboxylesterase